MINEGTAICNSSVIVRKNILIKIGGISENKNLAASEDFNTWLRIAQITDQFKYLKKKLGYYLIHDASAQNKDLSIPHKEAVIDFMNVGKLSAITLHDSATLTCMANDYGYENAFSNIIKLTLKPKDILIAISSSGQSKNIINAVESAKNLDSTVITFSGFKSNNPLRKMGDINFWCNSKDYGMVEIGHQFLLHNLADKFMDIQS